MAAEAEWEDRLFKQAGAMAASAAKASVRDGTIPSIGREAIKDVRNTIHEVFFGRPEGHNEPGTPLNPTPGEIAADRREDMHPYGPSRQNAGQSISPASPAATVAGVAATTGVEPASPLPSAGDIAYDRDISPPSGSMHGQEQPQSLPTAGDIAYDRDGQVLEQKSWQDRLREEQGRSGGGNDGGGIGDGDSSDKAGYDRQKERIKPEEERQERKEQERGGRC